LFSGVGAGIIEQDSRRDSAIGKTSSGAANRALSQAAARCRERTMPVHRNFSLQQKTATEVAVARMQVYSLHPGY
jgi:hypothetical protein